MFSEITLGPSFFHSPSIVLENSSVIPPSVLDAIQPLPFLHTVRIQAAALIAPPRYVFLAANNAASRFVLFHLCLDFDNLILNSFCCRCRSLRFASRCEFFQQSQQNHFTPRPVLYGNIQYSSASSPQTSHVLFKIGHLRRSDPRCRPTRPASHSRERSSQRFGLASSLPGRQLLPPRSRSLRSQDRRHILRRYRLRLIFSRY